MATALSVVATSPANAWNCSCPWNAGPTDRAADQAVVQDGAETYVYRQATADLNVDPCTRNIAINGQP